MKRDVFYPKVKIARFYETIGLNLWTFCEIRINSIDNTVRKSEFVSILGQSGCGKTTLLNIIGGLDRYTTGDLIINGKSTEDFKDKDWDSYRNYSVGFYFGRWANRSSRF